nr:hypothetical protein [Exiguobacterium antarcticum]
MFDLPQSDALHHGSGPCSKPVKPLLQSATDQLDLSVPQEQIEGLEFESRAKRRHSQQSSKEI